MTVKLKTPSAQYLMTDAVETSAIAYWAEARNIKRSEPDDGTSVGYVTSFQVRDGGYEGPRVSDKWITVDSKAIAEAIEKIRNGVVKVRRDIAAQFVGEEWDHDIEGVDVVIQTICFNNLVFG